MKSLDILNRVIQSYQKCFIIGSLEEADKLSCLEMVKIKQDLEVLEIIRKVVFKKYQMFYYVSDYGMIDRGFWVSDKSHECTEFELDEEEYNKVKQWLEANENE